MNLPYNSNFAPRPEDLTLICERCKSQVRREARTQRYCKVCREDVRREIDIRSYERRKIRKTAR